MVELASYSPEYRIRNGKYRFQ
uniref:Uncharacterized protein n=1 Tax=Arundo donax TaxID=35708 RepID=A0A0A9BDV7_ARUDO